MRIKSCFIALAFLPLLVYASAVKNIDLKNWRSQGAAVANGENGTLLLTFSKAGGAYPQARKGVNGDLSAFDTLSFKLKSSIPLRDLTVVFWSNGQRAIAGVPVYAGEYSLPGNEWVECRWYFRKNPGWVTPARKTGFNFNKVNAIAFNCSTGKFAADSKAVVEISDLKFIKSDPAASAVRQLSNLNWKKEGAAFTRTPDGLKISYNKTQGKYPQVSKNFPNGLAGFNRFSCEIRTSVPMPGLAFILRQGKYRAIASAKEVAKVRAFPAGKWCKVQWDFRKTPGWITPPHSSKFDFDKANSIAFNCTTASLPPGDHFLEVRNMRFETADESKSADSEARAKFAAGKFTGSAAGKKVVVWPNHGVTGSNILENFVEKIALYQALPIDGVNLDMAQAPFRDSFFSPDEIDESAFVKAKEIVKNTRWGNLKSNFFRIDIASSWGKNPDGSRRQFDWFDDKAWEVILRKITRFSEVCRECGFNIMFDTEAYTTEPYDYYRFYRNSGRSFAEYQAKVRQRGREVAEAFAKGDPDAVIMMMFASWIVKLSPEEDRYGLLPAFLDGMCEAETKLTLIDGYEGGYEFTNRASVINGLYNIKVTGVSKSSIPARYKKMIKTGFGVWLRPSVFSPEAFDRLLNDTLELSDGYVWIYLQDNPVTDEKVRKCFAAVRRK